MEAPTPAQTLVQSWCNRVERELGAVCVRLMSDPDGIRTRVTCVKGGCPRPLDDGVWIVFVLEG